MPVIIPTPDTVMAHSIDSFKVSSAKDYKYPDSLDLKPGSKLHQRLMTMVTQRALESHNVVKKRYDLWDKIEQSLTAYMTLDSMEQQVIAKDARKPVSIVMPQSYAVLETLLTYMMSTFIQDPIFRYEGIGPEDRLGALLLENDIRVQLIRSKAPLALHTQFRDALVYGYGIVGLSWEPTYVNTTVTEKVPNTGMFGFFQGEEEVTKSNILFEGNALINIDPRLALPDPNFPIQELQKGEYFGWVETTTLMSLLTLEANDDSYFNVTYLKRQQHKRSSIKVEANSQRDQYTSVGIGRESTLTSPVDLTHMYITLIPKDVGLGDAENPEIWFLTVANDSIVIRAKPLGLNHNMYPVAVCAPDTDGYSITPTSRMEIVNPMQRTTDWLISSHLTNIRKSLNNQFVVDPSKLNMNDFLNPQAGMLIRLTRNAWGSSVDDAIKQFPVTDVTRGNIADASYLAQQMYQVSGALESMQGMVERGGERVSATESRGSRWSAMSRLQKMASLISYQSMYDVGMLCAYHTQQMSTQDRFVTLHGETPQRLLSDLGLEEGQQVAISPDQLNVNFDVTPHDGATPGIESVETMTNLFQMIMQNPDLGQQFDTGRIFKSIARKLGEKNIDDYMRKGGGVQTQVQPDAQVQQQADAGNLVAV